MRVLLAITLTWLLTACSPVGTTYNGQAGASNGYTQTPSPFPSPFPGPLPAPGPGPGANPFAVTPLKLGALGDSITRAFNINQFNVENPLFSFSTGDSLATSVINRLKIKMQQNGWPVNAASYNYAVSGETVLGANSTFAAQATVLATASPYMVTVAIGSNDLCQGFLTNAAAQMQFRDRVVTSLRALTLSANPPKVIFLGSIPRVSALTQIPELAAAPLCLQAWPLLCPNLQIGQAAFDAQWAAANQSLAQAAATLGATVIYDGGAVGGTVLTVADVSAVDCFHPSVNGQGKLAMAVWTTVQARINQLLPAP